VLLYLHANPNANLRGVDASGMQNIEATIKFTDLITGSQFELNLCQDKRALKRVRYGDFAGILKSENDYLVLSYVP